MLLAAASPSVVSGDVVQSSTSVFSASPSSIPTTPQPLSSPSTDLYSKSHVDTFPSLFSLGIGFEEGESEGKRTRAFWWRKRAGSVSGKHGNKDETTPHPRDRDHGDKDDRDKEGGPEARGGEGEDHDNLVKDVESKDTAAQDKEKEKNGSFFSRSGTKSTRVVDEEKDGRDRVEKHVSLALMSILPASTIRKLSPAGEALIKAGHAASSIGHSLAPVIKEGLVISTDVLRFAPVPGLEEAARVLLGVWQACEKVDTNRLSCLRLTERCAMLLYSVRSEIVEAGEDVAKDLAEPIERLCDALNQASSCYRTSSLNIRAFLETQLHRPFLKRYLRRDEISRELMACNRAITDVGSMFGMSIQIRTLKQVYAAANESRRFAEEAQHHLDMEHQMHQLQFAVQGQFPQSNSAAQGSGAASALQAGNALGLTIDDVSTTVNGNGGYPTPPPAYRSPASMVPIMSFTPTPIRSTFSGDAALPGKSNVAMRINQEDSGRAGEEGIAPWNLPNWAITRYEVDLTRKIGIGFFSDVYLGRWRAHTVSIKVLVPTTPRSLFVREINVWRSLEHPNVLPLYGASSAVGDRPWFFVSRFCSGGSLVEWLNRAKMEEKENGGLGARGSVYGSGRMGRGEGAVEARALDGGSLWREMGTGDVDTNEEQVDLLGCMHQIAKGMEYLHGRGVLHGDLKAANVLVDETGRCLISGFGQSGMESGAYRLSGQPTPRGALPWQAPELLLGDNQLTRAVDTYAFAICCVEILGMGDLPWAMLDDGAVTSLVLDKDQRPPLPKLGRYINIANASASLIQSCWDREPDSRPSFVHIAASLAELRRREGHGGDELPFPLSLDEVSDDNHQRVRSPDMHPTPLSFIDMESWSLELPPSSESPPDEHYETASENTPVDMEKETFAVPGSLDMPPTSSRRVASHTGPVRSIV
ncbi:hypothetical protein PAXRUDRAFT_156824 [Paxillus rubicundulus Ve08.2h10]|uniref:Protein kinase domain-containing protein n=1 Tax=Paxillus rubicundulus Ve08.2h10 TaxID=930991 RepID=A0A0D0CZL0_9AGAM|nr:hypothetical protein PAXRUDRAFT_156824 [Paxillus rubicundulus Ve08.2h10]